MSKSSDSKKTSPVPILVPTNYLTKLKVLLHKLRDDYNVSNSDLVEVEGNLIALYNQVGRLVLDYSINVSHISNSVQVVVHTHSLNTDGEYANYVKEAILILSLEKTNEETN